MDIVRKSVASLAALSLCFFPGVPSIPLAHADLSELISYDNEDRTPVLTLEEAEQELSEPLAEHSNSDNYEEVNPLSMPSGTEVRQRAPEEATDHREDEGYADIGAALEAIHNSDRAYIQLVDRTLELADFDAAIETAVAEKKEIAVVRFDFLDQPVIMSGDREGIMVPLAVVPQFHEHVTFAWHIQFHKNPSAEDHAAVAAAEAHHPGILHYLTYVNLKDPAQRKSYAYDSIGTLKTGSVKEIVYEAYRAHPKVVANPDEKAARLMLSTVLRAFFEQEPDEKWLADNDDDDDGESDDDDDEDDDGDGDDDDDDGSSDDDDGGSDDEDEDDDGDNDDDEADDDGGGEVPDTEVPTGTVKVNNDDEFTKSRNGNQVTLDVSDNVTATTDLMVAFAWNLKQVDLLNLAKYSPFMKLGDIMVANILPPLVNLAGNLKLPGFIGANFLNVLVKDLAGNIKHLFDKIKYDPTKSAGSLLIDNGALLTNNLLGNGQVGVNLKLDFTDDQTPVGDLKIRFNVNKGGNFGSPYIRDGFDYGAFHKISELPGVSGSPPVIPFQINNNQGKNFVNAEVMDLAGNLLHFRFDNIHVDTKGPVGTVKINKGQAQTNRRKVLLDLTAVDRPTPPQGSPIQMKFAVNSTNPAAFSAYEDFSATKIVQLTTFAGDQFVNMILKDDLGNEGFISFDKIEHVPPKVKVVIPDGSELTDDGKLITSATSIDIIFENILNAADIDTMAFNINKGSGGPFSAPEPFALNKTLTIPAANLTDGRKFVNWNLGFKEEQAGVGNLGPEFTVIFDSFVRDTGPPTFVSFLAEDVLGENTKKKITVETNEFTKNVKIKYGTDPNNLNQEANFPALITNKHIMVLMGLDPNTTYHYTIEATDEAHNTATSALQSFTTPA